LIDTASMFPAELFAPAVVAAHQVSAPIDHRRKKMLSEALMTPGTDARADEIFLQSNVY